MRVFCFWEYGMNYSFDIDDAVKYGVEEAVLLHNFKFWLRQNLANNTHVHDDNVWTYNSQRAMTDLFPFWSKRQVERILSSLIKQEVLITGNYNKMGYDRTLWYAMKDVKALELNISPNGDIDITKPLHGNHQTVTPIPDSKPDIKPDIKKVPKKFVSPTELEVTRHAKENNLNAQGFFDYYESNGWKVGKNSMKNWNAALSGWSKRQYGSNNNGTRSNQAISGKPDSKATQFHNAIKGRYEEAVARELGTETVQQVPGHLRSQMVIGS
tara:strand:- start:30376 stop:31182 length:807 start_codon:yes stop_codon:yes gene_type:complete